MLRNLTLTIIFQGRKKNISARAADNLLDVLRKFGMAPESPCGGTGKCGKCRVVTVEPHNKKRESVLACRIFLNCDLIVEIPEFNKYTVNSGEIIPECENKPYFFTEEIILDENYPVLPDVLQKKCRAADHKTVWVIKKHGCPEKTLDIFTSRPRCLGLAVDLGTTTLAAVLYDLENGKQLSQSSMASSQRAFGHNVISRLQYSLQPNGLTELQKLAAGDITRLAENCCAAANENTGDIYETVVSGNTVMMHLAAGVSPETLAVVPFSPAIMGGNFKAGHLGIKIHNEAEIYFTRAIGSFVGGDITSGVLALNLADAPRPLLFIDIGTNGEIVLFGEEKIFACSAAAGPAFEGGNISCGMSAAGGAISSVKLMDQALRITTINNAQPAGICGSGIFSLTAFMKEYNILDEYGSIQEPCFSGKYKFLNRYIAGSGGSTEFIVYNQNEKKYSLTQKDLREIQMAKSAIRSAIDIMLLSAEIRPDDLKCVYIAGAFGSAIPVADALSIGLLPKLPPGKFRFCGNTSLQGSCLMLANMALREKAEQTAKKIQHKEIASHPRFQELFADNMLF